jgi:hypothetical protein
MFERHKNYTLIQDIFSSPITKNNDIMLAKERLKFYKRVKNKVADCCNYSMLKVLAKK